MRPEEERRLGNREGIKIDRHGGLDRQESQSSELDRPVATQLESAHHARILAICKLE